jgi:RimJ/RimL family protein N-acetyltransferase
MSKLICTAITSLDGYIEDRDGRFDWRFTSRSGQPADSPCYRSRLAIDLLAIDLLLLRIMSFLTMQRIEGSSKAIRLRRVSVDDLAWMTEMACDPELVGRHNWGGEPRDRAEVSNELRQQFDVDGFVGSASGTLVVELVDGLPIGDVSWRTEQWGPSTRSRCPAIGIALLPPFRGAGHGTVAQRLLIDRLFMLDEELHRVQSDTAVDNVAEQRALTKVGMTVEGRVRSAEFRDGMYHDHLLYSILRSEWELLKRNGH